MRDKGPYVPGYGNANSPIMVIGEAPGSEEVKYLRPFIGPAGRLLDSLLEQAGIDPRSVYKTNVCKYQPPANDWKRLNEIGIDVQKDCIPQLYDEIRTVNPRLIIGTGNIPLQYLTGHTGITNYRGSYLRSYTGHQYIAVIHPSAFLRAESFTIKKDGTETKKETGPLDYQMRSVTVLDFMKAKKLSELHSIYTPARRTLEVCTSSSQLRTFLELYKNKRIVSIDIETHKCVPMCIGLAFSSSHALSIPLITTDLKISYSEIVSIWKLLDSFLRTDGLQVIGQNWKFDQEKLEKPCGFKVPDPWVDTMFLAHTLHPEFKTGLAFLTSIYTNEPYYKDEYKLFDPKKDKIEDIFIYNAKDAATTFEICYAMLPYLEEAELVDFFWNRVMPSHRLYRDLEDTGFKVDMDKRRELWNLYDHKELMSRARLNDLAGHELKDTFHNSPKQIAEFLFSELKLPIRKSTDEDTLVALQANHCSKDPKSSEIIDLILQIRRFKKTKSTYLEAEPDYDGRMRTNVRIVGTETGRTSNNVLKPPVRPTQVGLAFQTMTKHGDIGAELRSLFVADEGYILFNSDLSQAEARIVALLARDEYLLELFRTKQDIHSITASWIFNKDPKLILRDTERFIGKTARHSGGYGTGKNRFMLMVNTDIKKFKIPMAPISEKTSGDILKSFHGKSPNIRGVFHEEVEAALKEFHLLRNPFGRAREFFGRIDYDTFKEGYAWIPQSTVTDHLRGAMTRIKSRAPYLRFVVEAHDAFTALIPINKVDEMKIITKEEMEVEIDFSGCSLSRGKLIIPCDIEIGYNYLDLKKVS